MFLMVEQGILKYINGSPQTLLMAVRSRTCQFHALFWNLVAFLDTFHSGNFLHFKRLDSSEEPGAYSRVFVVSNLKAPPHVSSELESIVADYTLNFFLKGKKGNFNFLFWRFMKRSLIFAESGPMWKILKIWNQMFYIQFIWVMVKFKAKEIGLGITFPNHRRFISALVNHSPFVCLAFEECLLHLLNKPEQIGTSLMKIAVHFSWIVLETFLPNCVFLTR